MAGFNAEALFEMMALESANKEPLRQQAINDAYAMLLAAGVALKGAENFVVLTNGKKIRPVEMDLDTSMGYVIKSWSFYRGIVEPEEIAEFADSVDITKTRMNIIRKQTYQDMLPDDEILKLARGLRVPEGVLVTRLRPIDVFKGVHVEKEAEADHFPKIDVHFGRNYGQCLIDWGEVFELTPRDLDKDLGFQGGTVERMAENGNTRHLEAMARKMRDKFNVPPGVIYTRATYKDVRIR